MSAFEGKDYTALIEACGQQLVSGYTYCRMREGQSSEELLYFVGPLVKCKRDSCIDFKIFDTKGDVAHGDSIPKGKYRVGIPWSKLLKRDTFEITDRGFWPFTYNIYWLDSNGFEQVTKTDGEIRLRVIKKEYIPLHQVVNDKNFTWIFTTRGGERVRMTTGGRTFVGKKP